MSRSYRSAKREHKRLDITFTLDDVEFRCAGRPTVLDISELAEVAELGVDTEDPRAIAAMSKFFRAVLGKEYTRFREHMRTHDTGEDVLVEIMQGIMEDLAGRPTEEPSHSQDGPSTTGPMSRVVSLQRGSVYIGQQAPGQKAAEATRVVSYG
jgi:hypothetical protein